MTRPADTSARRGQAGFSLLEGLVAIALLGVVLTGLTSTFLTYLDANSRSEHRGDAVALAQRAVETLRRTDPVTLPSSGSSPVGVLTLNGRDYEVLTHYCRRAEFCTADTRHLEIEIGYGGRTIYAVETVFTALR